MNERKFGPELELIHGDELLTFILIHCPYRSDLRNFWCGLAMASQVAQRRCQ